MVDRRVWARTIFIFFFLFPRLGENRSELHERMNGTYLVNELHSARRIRTTIELVRARAADGEVCF